MNNNNETLKHSTWYIATIGENYHLKLRATVDKPFKRIMEFVPNCLVKGLHLEFPFFKNQSCCDRGATWGRS